MKKIIVTTPTWDATYTQTLWVYSRLLRFGRFSTSKQYGTFTLPKT